MFRRDPRRNIGTVGLSLGRLRQSWREHRRHRDEPAPPPVRLVPQRLLDGVVWSLREMGLGEQQRVRLVSRHPSLICQVCNARVALSQDLAKAIMVEPLSKAR